MPGRHGPTGPCGCCGDCFLATDDFNRPDSARPGGEFVLLAVAGGINSNTLLVNETGVVATTKCHSNIHDLGSFESTFDLVSPEDGDIYEIACGNPNDPKAIVTYSFSGIPGSGGYVTIEIETDGEDVASNEYSKTIKIDWISSTLVSARICYAPGLAVTASIFFDGSAATPDSEACIGEGNTAPCWDATDVDGNEVKVGNFTFLQGHYDNWEYYVNFVDYRECVLCSCNCFRAISDNQYEYSCVPKTIHVTIGSDAACTGLAGTYAMFQRIRRDAPTDQPPDVDNFQQKFSWVTNPIICPQDPDYQFVLELICLGNSKEDATAVPNFQLNCIKYADGGLANVADSNFGFDPTDPFTITGGTTIAAGNVSEAACKSGSCDPLNLAFPKLIENSYSAGDPATGTVACCGGYVSSGGAYEPSVSFTVTVTE